MFEDPRPDVPERLEVARCKQHQQRQRPDDDRVDARLQAVLADGGLSRLLKHFRRALLSSHVGHDPQYRGMRFEIEQRSADLHRKPSSILGHHRQFDVQMLLRQQIVKLRRKTRQFARVHQIRRGQLNQLFAGVPQHVCRGLVDVGEAAGLPIGTKRKHEQAVAGVQKDLSVPSLAAVACLIRGLFRTPVRPFT